MAGFQSYLDNAEQKTGVTPRRFLELATQNGLSAAPAAQIISWLKADHALGHGHAANLAQLILKDPVMLADKYNGGVPLRLDGIDGG